MLIVWRTTAKSEIDYVEEYDGKISACEFKWSEHRKPREPIAFRAAYPESAWHVVSPANYADFLTRPL